MPKRTKITESIFARGVSHIAADINDIESKHRITPADLTRGLLEAAVAFYREHGFFSFPVRIEPEAFQKGYIQAVAEGGQGEYEPSATAQIEADEAARRDDLARARATRKKRGAGPRSGATGRG